MPRAGCFCGFKEGDTNCYVSDADKCPVIDDCRLGAKVTADGVVFDKMNEAERLQAEEKIAELKKGGGANKRPASVDTAAPSRPGGASGGGADLSDLETSLSNLDGTTKTEDVSIQKTDVLPVSESTGKKRGRRSKAQIKADEAAAKVAAAGQTAQDTKVSVEQVAQEAINKVAPAEETVETVVQDVSQAQEAVTVEKPSINVDELSQAITNFTKELLVTVSERIEEFAKAKIEELAIEITPTEHKCGPVSGSKRGPKKGAKRGPKKGKKSGKKKK